MSKPQKTIVKTFLLVLYFVTATMGCNAGRSGPSELVTRKPDIIDNEIMYLWERSDVLIEPKDELLMSTIDDAVVFNGSLSLDGLRAITVIDAYDGQVIWQKRKGHLSSVAANSDTIFIGNTSSLEAYNARNGSLLWKKPLGFEGEVLITHVAFDTVHINTENRNYFSINIQTGEVEYREKYHSLNIYFRSEDETIKRSANVNGIILRETQTNTLKWATEFLSGFYQYPAITSNEIFVRMTPEIGQVIALSRDTGEILWEVENIVSNLTILDSQVFLLRDDSTLVGVDIQSGKIQKKINFGQEPLVLQDNSGYKRGFYVVADEKSNVIFVYLGDSNKLFAFQVKALGLESN